VAVLRTDALRFSDMRGRSLAIIPKTPIVRTNHFLQPKTDLPHWPSGDEIDKILPHPRWNSEDLDLAQLHETIKSALAKNRGEIVGSFEENIAWKQRKLAASPWFKNTTYTNGVIVTKSGQMFLWEIYLSKHLLVQDKEGRILRIQYAPDHR
jgi:hypothetical protein